MNEYIKSVSKSGLFKYLQEKDHEQAWHELNMAPRNYRNQQIIYGQEDTIKRAGIVHTGLVKGERLHPEGTSSLAYYYAKGEVFAFEGALSGRKTSPLQLTADGNTSVIFFDVQKVFTCSFEKQLTKGLMELLANDDIKKLYRIEVLSKKSLRDRIMTHFTMMAGRSDDTTFVIDMSREQLANYLCVNRSALSYELNEMKREGIIDFEKRKYTILKKHI
ncbi:MAG: Crp/Fnr family transcriptional regulator [Bacillota bacterium]|nr:Crp/Fnr family transcriptional regulator [Bacillota bacterium]